MSNLLSNKITSEELLFLNELLQTVSPSGCENEAAGVISGYLKDYCHLESDLMGNLYASDAKETVAQGIMVTAHIDEVGFQITRITACGLAHVRRLGGLDRQTMPGTMLCVAGKSRDLIGVFGKTSPHVQRESEKSQVIEQDSLWVDFGFVSKDEALEHIGIGDYLGVIPNNRFDVNNHTCISKGLDNKISAFILAVSLKRLAVTGKLPHDLTAVFTVQEEIGCRGAIVACQRLNPRQCICLDVGIATDIPTMKQQTSISEFYLHKGPGLCITPDNNPAFVHSLIALANSSTIPFQLTTCFRPAGGTETSRIQLEGGGISTAHISIPNRYMHSAVEMCSMEDANNTIHLLAEYLASRYEAPKNRNHLA